MSRSRVRSFVSYVVFIAVFVAAILAILQLGGRLPSPAQAAPTGVVPSAIDVSTLRTLLLQIVVTLLAARAMSAVAGWLGQPRVVGEIAGGILLGPTILGHLSPWAFQSIFPAGSLGALKLLADIGVALFMFRVGLELDLKALRQATHRAIVISHASIVIPFLLGTLAALGLYRSFAPQGHSFAEFALFIGIAMSITAFPVLARILTEKRMAETPLGTMALTCAAVDDITAWSLLAMIVAVVRGQQRSDALIMFGLVIAFALTMVHVVRPLLSRFEIGDAGLFILLFGSAAITEAIGIHAIFGAFLAGVIVPMAPERRRASVDRLAFVTPSLLPLFFAYIGVRTNLELLRDARSAWICLAVIAIATAGKLGGSALAARVMGSTWRDALALGALMNTRGLMELVALNIGYDLGLLTPAMFAILVVMALATTIATGPLLTLFQSPSVNISRS